GRRVPGPYVNPSPLVGVGLRAPASRDAIPLPLCFLMPRPPPSPPLFPYTTLFRSLQVRRGLPHAHPGAAKQSRDCFAAPGCACGDRKSTRLNSSHDQISYAVFCLKKERTSCPTASAAWAG